MVGKPTEPPLTSMAGLARHSRGAFATSRSRNTEWGLPLRHATANVLPEFMLEDLGEIHGA